MRITKTFTILLFLVPSMLFAKLADHPDLATFKGTWKLLDSNYYLGPKLIEHKGDMNIVFFIKIEGKNMIWTSQRGITKTFFFDFETVQKSVTTAKYSDKISSTLIGNVLTHSVERKFPTEAKPRRLKNTFMLKKQGKTMHHIFEDFNGKDVYKVYSIYGRDPKSVTLDR